MDSITQGLLGAAVSECGFRHKLGRGATLMGAIGGLLPDLDIFLGWMDPWWTWQYHRHFTHSIFFAPLLAAPLAWLFWRRHGRQHFALWLLCAYLALATHPFLDLLTTYGTQLLAPFSDTRFGLDWIAIIDPLYSLILIITIVGCVLLRRKGLSALTWRTGSAGMALSLAYLSYGALNHHWAIQRIYEHAQKEGQHVLAARAVPNVGSVYAWRLVYRTDSGYYVGRTNTRFGVAPKFTYLPIEDSPLIAAANEHPKIRLFRKFTMDWARPILGKTDTGHRIVYDDLRYAWPPGEPRSLWAAVVDLDPNGIVLNVFRASNRRRAERTTDTLWKSFWQELAKP
ncbi:MAG: metal-dependent hydrolase [Phycisphaerae bacterium]|nr:metal-dependent hydrolase [Phycisphaerae bacterium]